MGNHDDCIAGGMNLFELFHDDMGRMRVEVTSRLVGEDDFGLRDDSASDSGALLLAAGELIGIIIFFIFKVEAFEGFRGAEEAAGFMITGVN